MYHAITHLTQLKEFCQMVAALGTTSSHTLTDILSLSKACETSICKPIKLFYTELTQYLVSLGPHGTFHQSKSMDERTVMDTMTNRRTKRNGNSTEIVLFESFVLKL